MTRCKRRRGVTLVETLLYSTLALALLGMVHVLVVRLATSSQGALERTDRTAEMRRFVTTFVRDVHQAHLVAAPQADGAAHFLELYCYGSADGRARLELAASEQGRATVTEAMAPQVDVVRVIYSWEGAEKPVVREITPGVLTHPCPAEPVRDSFVAKGAAETATYLPSCTAFKVQVLAFDRGRPGSLQPAAQGAPSSDMACVALCLAARPESSLEAEHSIVTKAWSYEKLAELAHPASFSSLDPDVTY